MKIYAVVLACVLAGAFAQDDKNDDSKKKYKILLECAKKHNLECQKLSDYHKALEAGGEQIQSVCHCVLKGMGHLDNNDDILYDEIKKEVPRGIEPEKFSGFVDRCKSDKGATPVETSYKFAKCITGQVFKAYYEKKQQQQGAQLHLSLF
ncbi:hypothetical protein FQA39_LY02131 [Lamprigera yunnana]|nr:hypothetical protein FQA39_LY02131 [Lamprigera yunnana]